MPPFVKAKFFSRFEKDVVEERRQAALKLLEFVAHHPPLFTSDVFVKFFESGYDFDGPETDSAVPRSSSPLNPDTRLSVVSDDDHTSFTTDTDSICSPVQGPDPEDISVEEDTSWSGPQLKSSLSQTTLSSLASVESVFSRRLQSFKNRFLGGSSDTETSDAKLKEAEMSKYWAEAQPIVDTAELREREGEYQQAFDCYKAAIAQLLQGVQNDTDRDRRKLVKERTADYLCKAEFIANHFLSNNNSSSRKEKNLVPLSQLWQPMADLVYYKVVAVVDKVMLAIDTRTHYLFIIKSIHKSSCPVKNKPCIMPRRVPYMVELNAIFENDCKVFLVLQYVSGGKLRDLVTPLLERRESGETPVKKKRSSQTATEPSPHHYHHCCDHLSVSDSCPSLLNVHVTSYDARSTVSSPGTSYVDLLRDYSTHRETTSEFSSHDTPQFTLNIEHSVDVDTKDLMEHAQRLLQSVDATLLESKSVISRVELNASDKLVTSQPTSAGTSLTTSPYKQARSGTTSPYKQSTTARKQVLESDVMSEFDRLSLASNYSGRSLDVTRLMPNSKLSSKGSSPPSSVGGAHWCQLNTSGPGIAEETVRRWAAQLVVALHSLHQSGITCMDLHSDNVLVYGTAVRLTYLCSFPGVEPYLSSKASRQLYTAPELMSIFPTTHAVDWWSLGVLLYHLLTGHSLSSYYPSGLKFHTPIYIPDTISVEAHSLLQQLLKYDPKERLGSGLLGVEEIKSHPFFLDVQWDQVYDEGLVPL